MKFSPRTFRVSFSLFRKVETIKHITSVEHINYKTSTTTKQWTLETTYSTLSLFFFDESRGGGRSSSGENSNLFSRSFPLFPYLMTTRRGDDFRALTSIALCYYLESLMMLIRAKLFPSNASVYFSTKSLQFSKWFTPSFR